MLSTFLSSLNKIDRQITRVGFEPIARADVLPLDHRDSLKARGGSESLIQKMLINLSFLGRFHRAKKVSSRSTVYVRLKWFHAFSFYS